MTRRSRSAALGLALVALAAAGCAAGGGAPRRPSLGTVTAAPADSVTLADWRMDETGGTRVADSGPLHLDARAGVDTRTDFGRLRNARVFTHAIDSFVYLPHREDLDGHRGLTVEAWVNPTAWGAYELTPIAGRWTQQAGEQSWMLALLGADTSPQFAALPGPNWLRALVQRRGVGLVLFAFQTEEAGPLRVFYSSVAIELNRWTHVAATFDGSVVKLYLDGRLDSQYAVAGRIRASRAPIILGNYLDWRWLSDFGGDLRVGTGPDLNPYYAFEGLLDDVRISTVARTSFPHVLGEVLPAR